MEHSYKTAILLISMLGFLATLPLSTWAESKIDLVDTKTGQPLKIDAAQFDTEAAKNFLATGQNAYIGKADAVAQGKKLYQLYSCTQCHGSQAQGQTAVGLTGPKFNHAKSATDKGMFEVIWAGTNGGMSAKGRGLMDPNDPKNGLSPDEVLKVIAWIRSQGAAAK
jgi:cytochrome c-L